MRPATVTCVMLNEVKHLGSMMPDVLGAEILRCRSG